MFRRLALLATVLAAIASSFAAEGEREHEAGTQKTIGIGRDRISPTDLTMSASDVLVIQNFSPYPKTVRFLSPENQADWAADFAALALCKPSVKAVNWVHLADAAPHQFPHCGLFDAENRPKPALKRLQELREHHLR